MPLEQTALTAVVGGSSIDANRMQLELWAEIMRVDRVDARDVLLAYSALADAAGARQLKLDWQTMKTVVGFREVLEDGTSVEMSCATLVKYLRQLAGYIEAGQVDQYTMSTMTEQLGYKCLLEQVAGENLDHMIRLPLLSETG